MYKHVIHVDEQPSFVDEISESMVHIGLEGGWEVAKSKEHNSQLEEPKRCREGSFPAVFGLDEDIVISPSYVKFGEDLAIFQFVHQFQDEW